MSKNNKSAKDLAFDKERARFRSEIRNLKNVAKQRDRQIEELNKVICQKEKELYELNKQVEKLLTYTEIPKEDLKVIIEQEKENVEVKKRISATIGFISNVYR